MRKEILFLLTLMLRNGYSLGKREREREKNLSLYLIVTLFYSLNHVL